MEKTQNLWILMATALGKKRESVFCSQVSTPHLEHQGLEPWKCCWNAVPGHPEGWDTAVSSHSNLKGGLVSWQ